MDKITFLKKDVKKNLTVRMRPEDRRFVESLAKKNKVSMTVVIETALDALRLALKNEKVG